MTTWSGGCKMYRCSIVYTRNHRNKHRIATKTCAATIKYVRKQRTLPGTHRIRILDRLILITLQNLAGKS